YAFTGLVSRINGADHVDEKITSPDVVKPSPFMDAASAYSYNSVGGTVKTGAETMISKLTLGTQVGSSVQSAQANQQQKAQAFQSTLGRGLSDGVSQDQMYSRMADVGRIVSSQHTAQSQMIEQQAKSFMQQAGVDQSHSDYVQGVVSAKANGSI